MKITIRGGQGIGKSRLAAAIADVMARVQIKRVTVDGAAQPRRRAYEEPPVWPAIDEEVEIVTRNETDRPTRTTAERVKSFAEELNAALHDLARECTREDVGFEATALEHEAKALYNRIMRLQSHRRWLGARGLPR